MREKRRAKTAALLGVGGSGRQRYITAIINSTAIIGVRVKHLPLLLLVFLLSLLLLLLPLLRLLLPPPPSSRSGLTFHGRPILSSQLRSRHRQSRQAQLDSRKSAAIETENVAISRLLRTQPRMFEEA